MHEHELHVSRALSATKLHALKHACRILDALDPATQFAEMRRLIGVILAARADDIEPHFGCSVPPVYGPPKPPHTDPNYNADHLEDLPPAPAGIVYPPRRSPPQAPSTRTAPPRAASARERRIFRVPVPVPVPVTLPLLLPLPPAERRPTTAAPRPTPPRAHPGPTPRSAPSAA
jgi:hypothetical protein